MKLWETAAFFQALRMGATPETAMLTIRQHEEEIKAVMLRLGQLAKDLDDEVPVECFNRSLEQFVTDPDRFCREGREILAAKRALS